MNDFYSFLREINEDQHISLLLITLEALDIITAIDRHNAINYIPYAKVKK